MPLVTQLSSGSTEVALHLLGSHSHREDRAENVLKRSQSKNVADVFADVIWKSTHLMTSMMSSGNQLMGKGQREDLQENHYTSIRPLPADHVCSTGIQMTHLMLAILSNIVTYR